jgi:hypothetical protein
MQQVYSLLGSQDYEARSHLRGTEANRTNQGVMLPFTNLRLNIESAEAAMAAGDRRTQCLMTTYRSKALGDLGRRTEAEQLFRTNLLDAERLGEEHPLTYCKLYFSRLLSRSDAAADWQEAEALAQTLISTQNPSMLGLAYGVLSQVSLQRGAIGPAVEQAQQAAEILRPFPPYRLDIVALWSRCLAAQGRTVESWQVAEQMVQQIEALGLESYGLLDLYAALIDSWLRIGDVASAQPVLGRALVVLHRRVADIPDRAGQTIYLQAFPEHRRLLALAAQWQLDLSGIPTL